MQIFANGVISGLTIALLAAGFAVVYLPTRVFYIAIAAVYALAPFISWACLRLGWPWYWSILTAVIIGTLFSIFCEAFNHAPLEKRQAPSSAHLISSLGIYIVAVQIVAIVWGNETKVLRTGLDAVWTVGGVVLTGAQVLAGIGSLILLALFIAFLQFSRLGLQFRALADNPISLALAGYDLRLLRLFAFGISGLMSSVSALLNAGDIGFDPHAGLPAALLAIVATVIGGRQSFLGPILGGILLGVTRAEASWFLSARWQEASTFLLLALFLIARPGGLFNRAGRIETTV